VSTTRRTLGASAVPAGEHVVTVVSAIRGTSAAGNRMIVWGLEFPGGHCLFHYSVVRRVETGLMAQALGLPLKPLRIADAVGRQCRATVVNSDYGPKVSGVRPL
jgi:hypothetical protein